MKNILAKKPNNKKKSFVTPAAYNYFEKNYSNKNALVEFLPNIDNSSEIIHMHSCRCGPLLSNEIYLSVQERYRNSNLKQIRGIVQPFGTVAKYLNYWLAGLSEKTCYTILSNIILELQPLFNTKNNSINYQILNDIAEEVRGDWSNLVRSLFYPLYLENKSLFNEYDFLDEDYNGLLDIHRGQLVSFEHAMLEISQLIVNKILRSKNLPTILIDRIDQGILDKIEKRYVNRTNFNRCHQDLMQKELRKISQAYNEMAVRLRSYHGSLPSDNKISSIYSILKSKRNSACSAIDLNTNDIRLKIEYPQEQLSVSIDESIILSIEAFNKTLSLNKRAKDDILYIDGLSMIEICFRMAEIRGIPLVLQELIRGDSKEIYKDFLKNFPSVKTTYSSCRIWDRKKFPEFDFNLVNGLKYLTKINLDKGE